MLDAQSQPMLIALMIALAAAGVIFAVIYPYLTGERRKEKRVQGIADAKARKATISSGGDQNQNRKKNVADTLKEMESRQKAKEKITLRLRLQRAGLDATPRDYYIASAISSISSRRTARSAETRGMIWSLAPYRNSTLPSRFAARSEARSISPTSP